MSRVQNLAPGRPYDPRAASLRGGPAGEPIRFTSLDPEDELVLVLGVRGSTTTDLTSKAEITGPGRFTVEQDTTDLRLFVVVYRPSA